MKKNSLILLSIAIASQAQALQCPDAGEVSRTSFNNFRRYDQGEIPNSYAYDATAGLKNGWTLRMQFYSTTPASIAKANQMKAVVGNPEGPFVGGEAYKYYCSYAVQMPAGITMISLDAEKW